MAAKKKTDPIPSWFNPSHKPDKRWIYIPQKTLKPTTELSRVQVDEGEVLNLKPDAKYRIETDHELEWGSCYYPNDTPSITSRVFLVEFSEEEQPNPHYKSQMKRYNEEMGRVEEWDFLKIQWDEQESRKKEIAERRKLAELKKKYEKN